jgi:hypothetical protein
MQALGQMACVDRDPKGQADAAGGLVKPAAHSVLFVIRLRMTEGITIYLIFTCDGDDRRRDRGVPAARPAARQRYPAFRGRLGWDDNRYITATIAAPRSCQDL